MKYSVEIFNLLSKGKFLSEGSINPTLKAAFNDLEDNLEEYVKCYRSVGFDLESGAGYYYFCRNENPKDLEDKLIKWAIWIDILECLVSYDRMFDVGTTFTQAQIEAKALYDEDLKKSLDDIFTSEAKYRDKIRLIVRELLDYCFIERVDETNDVYKVTPTLDMWWIR